MAVLDLSILPYAGPLRPIASYLFILYAVMEWNPSRAIALAAITGFIRDLAGLQPLGTEALLLPIVTAATAFVLQKLERDFILMRMAVAFLFTFSVLLTMLLLQGFLGSIPLSAYALGSAFFASVSTAFWKPFFLMAARRCFGVRSYLRQYELFS
jgi:rod shape-determining protein MreD